MSDAGIIARLRSLIVCALAFVGALVLSGPTAIAQQVLPPQDAFPYTVEANEHRLLVRFDIRDGYYLYRERFDFASGTDGVQLGTPRFPPGRMHTDEFFGEQEIYRGRFDIVIPYSGSQAATQLQLHVELQGCADIGLCYPPQDWIREVSLPATAPAPRASQPIMLGDLILGRSGPSALEEILPPERAFSMNARVDGPNRLVVSWDIEPGYYLYRDRFEFATDSEIRLGEPELPAGVAHHDEHFGDVVVFYDRVDVALPFARGSPDAMPIELTATFQGCKQDSICYPPIEQAMSLMLPAASEFAVTAFDEGPVTEQDRLAALLLSDAWWLVLGTFYGLGLLLAFTPCVLPMVPILSGIIAGHGQVSTQRAFALSLAYVLGMAVTYTAAGALAAIAGEQIQAIFQRPWIITLFSAMFVVLGLAMFGLFRLQMPAAVQTRLAELANRQSAGTFAGTAVIGALSALIVTTCVAPPLVAALAVIGQSGDVVRGSSALFALSLGMGTPLLVFGASAGKLMPKAGPWMNTVKAAFGIMLIGLAIWMLERILPGTVTLVMWALLVFLTGVFMGAFEPLPQSPHPAKRLGKGLGMLACLYGALMLIGAALGGHDPLRPIPQGAVVGSGGAAFERLPFRQVRSVAELEEILAASRAAGQPVMVDFTADWCVSCKEMERQTFTAGAVVEALAPFTLLQIDVTANNDDDRALLRYFSSYGPPTIAFYDASGRRLDGYTLVGFVRANEFATHVNRVAAL